MVGLTATLLAAKLNESIMPSYDLTVLLLPEFLQQKVSKSQFLTLEMNILTLLEFDLKYNSPIFFLGRYLHLFGIDEDQTDSALSSVGIMAHKVCQLLQREPEFLRFKPSQVAAASLMYAINIVNKRAEITNKSAIISVIAQTLQKVELMTDTEIPEDYVSLWTSEIQ